MFFQAGGGDSALSRDGGIFLQTTQASSPRNCPGGVGKGWALTVALPARQGSVSRSPSSAGGMCRGRGVGLVGGDGLILPSTSLWSSSRARGCSGRDGAANTPLPGGGGHIPPPPSRASRDFPLEAIPEQGQPVPGIPHPVPGLPWDSAGSCHPSVPKTTPNTQRGQSSGPLPASG